MSGRAVSIVAMPAKAFFRSPLEPGVELANEIHYERVDIEPQDINRVRLTVGGKTWVVNGIDLCNAVNEAIGRWRR